MKHTSEFQISAGGVLARREGSGFVVCLIRRERHGGSVWCLPKGHLEQGEDNAAAALREVREETGIRGRIIQELGAVRYQFKLSDSPKRFEKVVTFFLMEAEEARLNPQDLTEVVEANWFSVADAIKRDGYDNEKKILRKAEEALRDPQVQAAFR